MDIGTIDRTPPPFFRQGPSALTKLTFCSALALLLMVADTRFRITQPVRAAALRAARSRTLRRRLIIDSALSAGCMRRSGERSRAVDWRPVGGGAREQLLLENRSCAACSSCGESHVKSQASNPYEAPDPY